MTDFGLDDFIFNGIEEGDATATAEQTSHRLKGVPHGAEEPSKHNIIINREHEQNNLKQLYTPQEQIYQQDMHMDSLLKRGEQGVVLGKKAKVGLPRYPNTSSSFHKVQNGRNNPQLNAVPTTYESAQAFSYGTLPHLHSGSGSAASIHPFDLESRLNQQFAVVDQPLQIPSSEKQVRASTITCTPWKNHFIQKHSEHDLLECILRIVEAEEDRTHVL